MEKMPWKCQTCSKEYKDESRYKSHMTRCGTSGRSIGSVGSIRSYMSDATVVSVSRSERREKPKRRSGTMSTRSPGLISDVERESNDDKIYKLKQKLRDYYREIKKRENEYKVGLEKMDSHYRRQISSLTEESARLQKEMFSVDKSSDATVTKLENIIMAQQEKLNKRKTELPVLQSLPVPHDDEKERKMIAVIDTLNKENDWLKRELERNKAIQTQTEEKYKYDVKTLVDQMTGQKSSHFLEINSLKTKHAEELSEQNKHLNDNEKKLSETLGEKINEVDRIKNALYFQIDSEREEKKREISSLTERYEYTIKSLENKHKYMTDTLKEQHAQNIANINRENTILIAGIEKKKDEEIALVKKEKEILHTEVLSLRDKVNQYDRRNRDNHLRTLGEIKKETDSKVAQCKLEYDRINGELADENKRLSEKLEHTTQVLKRINDTSNSLQARYTEGMARTTGEYSEKIRILTTQLDKMKSEGLYHINSLSENLDNCKKTLEKTTEENNRLKNKIEELTSSLDHSKRDLEAIRNSKELLLKDRSEWLDDLKDRLVKEKNEEITKLKKDYEASFDSLNRRENILSLKIEEDSKIKNDLSNSLENITKERDEYKKKLYLMVKGSDDMRSKIEDLEATIVQVNIKGTNSIELLQKEKKELEEKIELLNTHLDNARNDSYKANQQRIQYEQLYNNEKAQPKITQKYISKIKDMEKTIGEYKEALAKAEADSFVVRDHCIKLEEGMKELTQTTLKKEAELKRKEEILRDAPPKLLDPSIKRSRDEALGTLRQVKSELLSIKEENHIMRNKIDILENSLKDSEKSRTETKEEFLSALNKQTLSYEKELDAKNRRISELEGVLIGYIKSKNEISNLLSP